MPDVETVPVVPQQRRPVTVEWAVLCECGQLRRCEDRADADRRCEHANRRGEHVARVVSRTVTEWETTQ